MTRQINTTAVIACSLILGLVLLPGCSHQPTLGERMMDQGAGTASLGKQWGTGNDNVQKGQKLIEQGNEMIEDAREELRDGEDKILKGKKLIEQGKQQMEDSERAYKTRFPSTYQRIYQTP